MKCPHIKECKVYRDRRQYHYVERFRCHHKEYWSKCSIYLETKKDSGR